MIDLFVKSLGRLLCETSYKGVIFVSVDALERGPCAFQGNGNCSQGCKLCRVVLDVLSAVHDHTKSSQQSIATLGHYSL